jgi:hypothetical protein
VVASHPTSCELPLAIGPPLLRTSPHLAAHAARAPAAWWTPRPPNRPPTSIKTCPQPLLRARVPPPEPRRPPLAPPGANLPPVDALTPTSPWALPCAQQKLPESLVDQAEPHDRWSPSSRGRRRTAIAELAPPPILRAQGPA